MQCREQINGFLGDVHRRSSVSKSDIEQFIQDDIIDKPCVAKEWGLMNVVTEIPVCSTHPLGPLECSNTAAPTEMQKRPTQIVRQIQFDFFIIIQDPHNSLV
jgi:hypothetical protein